MQINEDAASPTRAVFDIIPNFIMIVSFLISVEQLSAGIMLFFYSSKYSFPSIPNQPFLPFGNSKRANFPLKSFKIVYLNCF